MDEATKKCPKCGGNVLSDAGLPYCLSCGESPFSTPQRREWYNVNKRDMIADLKAMGNVPFLSKWRVRPSTIAHLKSDPLYSKPPAASVTPAAHDNGASPALPPFGLCQSEPVQLLWLRLFASINKIQIREDLKDE